MSKFWFCQAIAGTAAVAVLTASATGLLAAPKKTEHRAGVAQVTRVPGAGAATDPLPTPARVPPLSAKDVAIPGTPATQSIPAGPETALRGSDVLNSGSSIFMADVLVGAKLKELVASRLDRYISRARDRSGVEAFYRTKGYTPVWIGNGAPNLRTTSVTNLMKAADADGLDPASYHIPDFRATGGDPEKLAAAELQLTDAVLTYARHAQAGRFGAQRVTVELEVTQTVPEAAAVLQKVSQASNTAAALNSYNPPFPEYRALKAKLAELRRNPAKAAPVHTHIAIPDGPTLKRGMQDARVPLLRQRLKVAGNRSDTSYDNAVIAAVRKFQQQAGLEPDGILGPHSLEVLNGSGASPSNKVDAVVANMERWRWLPRELGSAHVMVNIPDFTLDVVSHRKTIWTTRIVVGKPDTPTPLVSAELETMQLNPTWHVPESIIYNEYLPALKRDPRILERMGLVLARESDGRVVVKQPPGEENALGQIKFNFPNRFQVYLHDTPTKHLFARSRRAYSHGCMRVQDPAKFGEVLLSLASPKDNYTEARLQKAWGGPEQWIKLRRKIPVHLVYMSAYVDGEGRLVVRDDIYGFDKKVIAILKGDDRRMADTYVAPVPKPVVVDAEKRRELERFVPNAFGAREGFGFLERLFH